MMNKRVMALKNIFILGAPFLVSASFAQKVPNY